MRKAILTLSIVFSMTGTALSQMWLDIGLKGGWGPTMLLNSNAFEDKSFVHQLTTGYMFGGKIGWNFNDDHEITFDVMHSQKGQRYVFEDTSINQIGFEKTVLFSTLDFALLYRHNKDGRHVEIGPVYSLVKKASGSNNHEANAANDGTDIRSLLIDDYFSLLFGFGGYFLGTENFGITLGARFTYGFSDMINAAGQSKHYPYFVQYPTYKKTSPLTAMLVMEANLDFAYMAKAKCKNKRKLILF